MRTTRRSRRHGGVLIVAMIVIFALASMVLVLGRSMRVEATASANDVSARKAMAIARGAEQYVTALLLETPETIADLPDSAFAAVPVGDGYFWLVRPIHDATSELPQFGLVDESAKLDLNTADRNELLGLPGMTEEIAGAIIDWRDEDEDTAEPVGAESPSYADRSDPYRAKNAPFEFVEELMLVHGMTREYLYGTGEPAADARAFEDEALARRLFDLLTVWSAEPPHDESADEMIEVDENRDRDELRDLLRETFGDDRGNQIIARLPGRNLRDMFDLAAVAEMTAAELAQIEHRLTTDDRPSRGLVNVNGAPREVLACLEGLDSSDLDTLLATRRSAVASAADPSSVAWVYEALGLEAVGLGEQITGRGRYHSADIVAVSGDGRAFRRVRIVVDSSATPPRIIHRRDTTDHGWPLDPSILASLRAARGVMAY